MFPLPPLVALTTLAGHLRGGGFFLFFKEALMGVRVTLPRVGVSLGSSGSSIADTYVNALRTLQGSVDDLGNLGGLTQRRLQSSRTSLDGYSRNPMARTESSLNINIGSLNNNTRIAIRVGPQRSRQTLSGISSRSSRLSGRSTSAFDAAKGAVTGTNAATALAIMALCILLATILQGTMSKLTSSALRLQRTLLAKMDSVRKQVVDLVEEAINAALEVLPECPQTVKEVIQELRSLLGKTSTIVAAVSKLLRDVAICAALGVALTGAANSSPRIMSGVTSRSRNISRYDFGASKREYRRGVSDAKIKIDINRSFYHNNPYLRDSTTVSIQLAKLEAIAIEVEVARLIEESKEHDHSDTPDSHQYKEALDGIKKDLDVILEDLNEAEEGLLGDTLDIVDSMSDGTKKDLDDLLKELEEETTLIEEATDGIFEGLENIAQEFDSPEVQERLVTSCADTQFRTVLDQ